MYKYPNGDVYLGHFKNDVFHIEGITYFDILSEDDQSSIEDSYE